MTDPYDIIKGITIEDVQRHEPMPMDDYTMFLLQKYSGKPVSPCDSCQEEFDELYEWPRSPTANIKDQFLCDDCYNFWMDQFEAQYGLFILGYNLGFSLRIYDALVTSKRRRRNVKTKETQTEIRNSNSDS